MNLHAFWAFGALLKSCLGKSFIYFLLPAVILLKLQALFKSDCVIIVEESTSCTGPIKVLVWVMV